ncbi:hypothetical protein DYU05_12605 [Mucilaginibacter terrenus]|uniref:Uncharacterized protein n=1 Tax=Mucilaginibacter terrenus TaxID=2482727 RepID=A0A3E2NPR9_9SPHI|nr:hypothetical protein [Mucilaginibacter terrenus]RFZ82988.1 hypothetical protein DYU05_12605 [Mucilaginibacter terrenus]
MKEQYLSNRLFRAALFLFSICCCLFTSNAYSQAEVEPWGNIRGIRHKGQLYGFESSIRVISEDGRNVYATAKERQQPKYKRSGKSQIVSTRIDSLYFTEAVTDVSGGKVKVVVQADARKDMTVKGVFFCISLPNEEYQYSRVELSGVKNDSLKEAAPEFSNTYLNVRAKSIQFTASKRKLKVSFDQPEMVIVRREPTRGLELYIPVALAEIKSGAKLSKSFTIKTWGEIDEQPISMAINASQQGRIFEGLGGNFRLQNPKTDPQVIDYSLKNLRVAYGRVEMPWRLWQPEKDMDPTAAAREGKLNPAVLKAMQMGKRLDSAGMPVILSAWFPPQWAALGKLNMRPTPEGIWGNQLDPASMDAIYKSITDYILYVKEKYGFEYKMFSFNESDLGINVRATPEEHRDFIKGLGAYMASKGLKTKMLLGDNSDATTYKFIYPALNDPTARPYIGAVSFHSWRGWDTEILQKWADAANQLNVPLIVGEGSIDAAAWNYPDIFQEQTYALEEINLYTRILAICQPITILQWQLTADYSPLIGGGIFGNNEPLHPGQRFWNLKQLANTPKNVYALPITVNGAGVSAAVLGDNSKGVYVLHLVNNGSTRKVTLTGLPVNVKELRYYITTTRLNMKEEKAVEIKNGIAKFKLPAVSYVTLISK